MITMEKGLSLNNIRRADPDDLNDVKRELEETRELCRKFDTIIENNPDGIYVTDGDATAIRINPAFSKISGLKREEMLGVNHRDLERDGVVYRSSALMVVHERRPVTIIHEYLPTQKTALVTSIPVYDEKGEMEMIVSSTRDLTELNEVKNSLAVERDQRLKLKGQLEAIQAHMLQDIKLIAVDRKMLNLLYRASRVAAVDSTVMISGETGSGKEEIAKYIHKCSPRANEPFIAINCGAIPENLVESELFGYEKGAFTGAQASGKIGLMELADKGTLFLDEVGELPLETQTTLLRALENRQITRVGGKDPININIRIISASHRDLAKMVEDGKFRADLYYRLNVVPIRVPSLRERKDDIVPLVNHFLGEFNKKYGLEKAFSNAAYRVFERYDWPGNVRELKNLVERAVVTSDGDLIEAEDLSAYRGWLEGSSLDTEGGNLRRYLEEVEYYYIKAAYERYGNVRSAAASLQMPASTFIRKKLAYEKMFQK